MLFKKVINKGKGIISSLLFNLKTRLLLNVLIDTLCYSMFGTAVIIASTISHVSFLEYRGDTLPAMLRVYIAGQQIYNNLSNFQIAFFATFLMVFVKHTSGTTADKSKEILKQIQKINAEND